MLSARLSYIMALGVLPSVAFCQCNATITSTSAISTPTPTYLFTATLYVGDVLSPIPLIEGDNVIIEPLVNGTIVGPFLNGTVHSGFTAATVVSNNAITGNDTSIQIPSIYVYGHTSDGLPFYVQEAGVGPMTDQNTRLVIAVGRKYSSLQSSFVLAQPSMNAARTIATVPCFSMPLPPSVRKR
ncbi:hypothetical protein SCUP515_04989 [Seiridium cupressi]